ncbi:hypothetical protein OEZ85_010793 [Tetradesmus obliquus]|uniref:SPX domain-containing protein n=1 Tax=Tetradesmus obliquus TaxID=3088 RepID=A0ABY8TQP1_TETOB|nr:hypothetical protein OEZ85_010793 [Tetradesmus obliquus]
MSTFALPADLALLVSELEHVLALNGHRAHQHAKYITEELQAKADSRDEQDEGKLQLCSTANARRAKELLLKHEAFEMCFDAFAQSLNMHLPSQQTNLLQKLWRHAMLLVEGWQDLHQQEQQEIKSLTLDYIHLQQEHRALKSNLKTLKLTVQAMLVPAAARGKPSQQGKEQGRGKACRNMPTARSADPSSPPMRHSVLLALVGASPNRSHPPSAYDNSLAWFLQNAQGGSSGSSRPGSGRRAGRTAGGAALSAATSPAARAGSAPADSQLGVLSPGDSVCQSATDSCSPAQGSTTTDAATPARTAADPPAGGSGAPVAAGRGKGQSPLVEALLQHPEALQAA